MGQNRGAQAGTDTVGEPMDHRSIPQLAISKPPMVVGTSASSLKLRLRYCRRPGSGPQHARRACTARPHRICEPQNLHAVEWRVDTDTGPNQLGLPASSQPAPKHASSRYRVRSVAVSPSPKSNLRQCVAAEEYRWKLIRVLEGMISAWSLSVAIGRAAAPGGSSSRRLLLALRVLTQLDLGQLLLRLLEGRSELHRAPTVPTVMRRVCAPSLVRYCTM